LASTVTAVPPRSRSSVRDAARAWRESLAVATSHTDAHECAVEVSCGVKVMVAAWPSKKIISWTSAEASVQSGSRQRDRDNAHRECLEATANQLAEDLAKFLKAQGG